MRMSKRWRLVMLVIGIGLCVGNSTTPLMASSLWGTTWGGYLGANPLSIWEIDSDTGGVSERIIVSGDDSRTGVLDFASDPFRNPSIVWSLHRTEQNGYELLSFDPYRQQVRSIVSLDDSLGLSGLAIDPTTGHMYGTSTAALYQIDPNDGAAVMIGVTTEDVAWALGFDLQGNLFGVKHRGGRLISVDKSSGATTSIGEFDAVPADIAVRKEDGVMFGLGLSGTSDFTYGLYTIDLETAAVSHIGPSLSRPGGLAFTDIPEPNTVALAMIAATGLAINRRWQLPLVMKTAGKE